LCANERILTLHLVKFVPIQAVVWKEKGTTMKILFTAAALAAALLAGATPALAQTNVSISVGQPGFYGRLDVGDFGRPPVMYAQPIVVERQVRYEAQPIYLRVPPGHAKHWSKHCAAYNACREQVYFVRDDWYSNTYAPRYQERHPQYREQYQQPRQRIVEREVRYEGRERHERDDDREHGHGNGHDNGHGNGNGHGKGHDRD
jgi:hypothetical protein